MVHRVLCLIPALCLVGCPSEKAAPSDPPGTWFLRDCDGDGLGDPDLGFCFADAPTEPPDCTDSTVTGPVGEASWVANSLDCDDENGESGGGVPFCPETLGVNTYRVLVVSYQELLLTENHGLSVSARGLCRDWQRGVTGAIPDLPGLLTLEDEDIRNQVIPMLSGPTWVGARGVALDEPTWVWDLEVPVPVDLPFCEGPTPTPREALGSLAGQEEPLVLEAMEDFRLWVDPSPASGVPCLSYPWAGLPLEDAALFACERAPLDPANAPEHVTCREGLDEFVRDI